MQQSPLIVVVAPLLRLPRQHQLFDYKILANAGPITVGSLVTIPFRRQQAKGIVIKIKQRSRFVSKLKPIASILAAGYVSPAQMKLAQRLALHYGVALSLVLKACLPILPNRRYQPDNLKEAGKIKSLSKRVTNFVFTYDRDSQRQELIISLVKKVLSRHQQVLLLVPERHWISYWRRRLAASWLYQFSLADKLSWQRLAWEACRRGQPGVIIGNRSALFLPFRNLGGIIIDQAEDDSYKQSEQNPRYDAIEVARWLAQINKTSVALVSAAPDLVWQQTLFKSKFHQRYFKANRPPFNLIDLSARRRAGDSGIITEPLRERIDYYLQGGGKVFLYLNRRGTAPAVICRDCGYYAVCPNCQRALVWDATVNKLLCFHCRVVQEIKIPCPICQSVNLNYRGVGLNRLVNELKDCGLALEPFIIEGEKAKVNSTALQQARLVVGSEAAWAQLNLADFSLVGFIAPDGELAVPEFRASQLMWQKVRRVLSYNIAVAIQTYQPNQYWWQSLAKNQPRLFYQTEAMNRQRYGYPPYRQLVRLTLLGDNETAVYKQAVNLRQRLQNNPINGVEVTAVYPDYYRRVRGRYRYHILIKYRSGTKLNKLWSYLPDEIIIDRHPRVILS